MLRVREVEHEDLAAIELVNAGARLVVVHAVGPRIAWFGRARGRNLLFWDATGTHRRGGWRLRGGHRVWVTRPLADETEESYAPDDGPCRVRKLADGVAVTAPPDVHGLEKSLAIRARADGSFVVENRVRNASDMLWSGGAWALTCTRPARRTAYGVPLGQPGASWDVFSLVIPRRWGGGHTSRVDDSQIRFTERCMVVEPRGRECKRMVQAPQGIIGMSDPDERLAFTKQAPYRQDGRYPLHTNIAFYVGPGSFMVEMETMGPQRTLLPGQGLVHLETWTLGKPIDWSLP